MMTDMYSAPITLNYDPMFEEENSPLKDDYAFDVKDDNKMQKSNQKYYAGLDVMGYGLWVKS